MKKLREEHENLSDLMFEDYRSGTDSISSSENYQDSRNKWHSAEDVRSRKVSQFNFLIKLNFFFLNSKTSFLKLRVLFEI